MCIDYSRTINLFTKLDAYPLPSIESIVNEVSKWKRISTLDLRSAHYKLKFILKIVLTLHFNPD